MVPDLNFYTNLPENKITLSKLLLKDYLFQKIPSNWHVIITDVKNSTDAVLSGKHEDVNFVATGSIVAVLNIAFAKQISIPFFFGGDGATFIIPPEIYDEVMNALYLYRQNTFQKFQLELRTGAVAVAEIYANNQALKVCKFTSSKSFSIPIILGEGLSYAEKIIKGPDYIFNEQVKVNNDLDLSGMQCRWDKIDPPQNSEEIVTIIAIARNGSDQARVFSKIISLIDKIYGEPEARQPISVEKLIFKTSFHNMRREMTAKFDNINFFQILKEWIINLYGKIYLRTENGQNYLTRLVEMSDTLVIDGKINTVITGIKIQREKLISALDELEKEQEIYYGVHISGQSVMSCYIRDLADDHIHFVDGGEGGYTQAACVLKKKIASG
ncbi:DUF3095 domain-containing protein [Pedobacter changchengzhani]|uniref:DUF3095 domain-containing protein n=1 Tax=Pedobacter changchengzhani TaxID=2529274 RepID=A0A4R5MM14_9SPHI|nr:DUF3095 family protein [Pedobacter changchengzhani]TDG36546.1 DUF3095 domain-containing protein [Pedobacter changchengzhani]